MAYSANRNNTTNMPNSQDEDQKKEQQNEATKKALKVGAKAAGAYFGGGVGAAAVGKIADSKVGDKVLNEGAEKLNRIPGVAKKTQALNDSGATDMADKAVDMLGSKGAGGAESASNAANGANTNAGAKTPASSSSNNSTAGSNNKPDLSKSMGGTSSDSQQSSKENEEGFEEGNINSGDVLISAPAKKVLIIGAIFSPFLITILIVIIIVSTIGSITSDYEDALSAYAATGGDTGGVNYEPSSQEAKDFYARIDEAKSSMESEGEELDTVKLVATYHIINRRDASYDYNYFTTERLKEIARQITLDKEETKQNLAQNIFPQYFPNNTQAQNESMANEVFEYIDNYKSMVGIKDDEYENGYNDDSACTGGTGVCTYNIKGFNIGGSITKKQMTINNLQVRLMQCGGDYGNGSYTKPINQPLVPFEKYVTGVSYAEIDTGYKKAAQQAQMIAARSYALARPTEMHNSLGKKLSKENGKWVLQISSCVADQVHCDIDKGCSYMGGGDGQGGYVISGTGKGIRSKNPMPSNSNTRKYSNEVQGMVLVDKNGYVVYSDFTSDEQEMMNSLAGKGLDYKQILLKMYPRATSIYKANCGADNCSGSTGDYSKWRQADKRWANTPMGTSGETLGKIGCLVTSISMLVAKSGVPTNKVGATFNPGTFVKALNKVGGIDGNGNYNWASVGQVVPKFKYAGAVNVRGKSKAEKLQTARDLTSKGYYVVAEVKGATPSNQHWVAIDKVLDNSILIMDPGAGKTKLWSNYYRVENTTQFSYFKVV